MSGEAHLCAALRCGSVVRPGVLFCWRCWCRLPKYQQRQVTAVWRDFRGGETTRRHYLAVRAHSILMLATSLTGDDVDRVAAELAALTASR